MIRTILAILLICSFTAAQTPGRIDVLNKTDRIKKDQKVSTEKSSLRNKLIQSSINKNQERIISLRKAGKSVEEITKILNASFKPDGMAGIEGYVYDTDGTRLKYTVGISIYDEYGYYICSAYPDTTGLYGAYGLQPGKYFVRTNTFEYYISEFYNNSPDWEHSELVAVTENTLTTNIDFYLDHHRGTISGHVKNKDGEGLKECTINLIVLKMEDYSDWITLGDVDSTGYYFFTGVPEGPGFVGVDYNGKENYLSQWYDGAADTSEAAIIEITKNDTIRNIDFILDYGATISGSVTAAPGIEPYDCGILLMGEDGGYRAITRPDSTMNFTFKGLAEGKYKIRYRYYGSENFVGGYYLNANSSSEATFIDVPAQGSVEGIIITFQSGGVISGVITDKSNVPINSYMLFLLVNDSDEEFWLSTVVNDGKYTLIQVPGDKYKINAPTDFYLDNWYNKKKSKEDADWITVNASDTLKNIDFSIDYRSTISGSVLKPDGSPYTSTGNISLYNLDRKFIDGTYFNGSDFELPGVGPGKYKLYLYCSDNDTNYANQWYNNALDFSIASEIEVTEGQDLKDIIFTLGYSGKVNGFIKNPEGQKVSQDECSIIFYNNQSGYFIQESYASFAGGFKVYLPYGSYKAAGISYNGEDSLAVTYMGGGSKFSNPLSSVLEINSIDPVFLDLVLEKAGGSIKGSVLQMPDSIMITAREIRIYVYDDEGRLAKVAFTADNSDYKINGLRPGSYYLLVNIWIDNNASLEGWYGVEEGYYEPFPNMNIPAGAVPVTVGTGTTEGVNFYYRITSVQGNDNTVNKNYNLLQNYPNPFNPVTKISFDLKEESFTKLIIYNSLGQAVKVLDEGIRTAGRYNINFDAGELTSGIYFYRLTAKSTSGTSEFSSVKKMILLK